MYNLTPFLITLAVSSAITGVTTVCYVSRASNLLTEKRLIRVLLGLHICALFGFCTLGALLFIPRYFDNSFDFWRMKIIFACFFIVGCFTGMLLLLKTQKQKGNVSKHTSNKSAILSVCGFAFLVVAGYLILDLFDIPSHLGVNISRLNTDVFGILIGGITTISVFAISFYAIEQWNLKKNANQKGIAEHLLLRTYQECQNWKSHLEAPETISALLHRTDGNKYYSPEDPSPAMRYADIPFDNDEQLMTMSTDGVLTADQIKQFIEIKNQFHVYVSARTIFFDHEEMYFSIGKNLDYLLQHEINKLTKKPLSDT